MRSVRLKADCKLCELWLSLLNKLAPNHIEYRFWAASWLSSTLIERSPIPPTMQCSMVFVTFSAPFNSAWRIGSERSETSALSLTTKHLWALQVPFSKCDWSSWCCKKLYYRSSKSTSRRVWVKLLGRWLRSWPMCPATPPYRPASQPDNAIPWFSRSHFDPAIPSTYLRLS